MNAAPLQRLSGVVVAVATPIVVIGAAVLLFLNPVWVTFEQDRSAVTAWTGYSPSEVRAVTGSILSDLVFGPPRFDVSVAGQPVLDARERQHMVDVREVMGRLGLVAIVALLALVAIGAWSRGSRWFWSAVGAGAAVLAVGVVAVGAVFGLFFDQAFELFHRLFFPPGTYDFNPATERLVQLFPDQFWSDTTIALAVVVLVAAVALTLGTRRAAAARGPAPWGAVR